MTRSNSECGPSHLLAEAWLVKEALRVCVSSRYRFESKFEFWSSLFAGKLPWRIYDYNCLIPGIGAEDSVVGPPTQMHSTFFPQPSVVLVATPTASNVCILVG
jgi:hypothetical protein